MLVLSLDDTGKMIEIPMRLGSVASDDRRIKSDRVQSVGISLGASFTHTPENEPANAIPGTIVVASKILFATGWNIDFRNKRNPFGIQFIP